MNFTFCESIMKFLLSPFATNLLGSDDSFLKDNFANYISHIEIKFVWYTFDQSQYERQYVVTVAKVKE